MVKFFQRSLSIIVFVCFGLSSFSQKSIKDVPNGWHLKDRQTSGFYGISLDKAYEFVKGKKSKTVVVAVIDSGIDTTHEDLKPVLWTNAKEVAGNGIDDDRNGYVDDIHGWNFLGGRDGRNVKEDSYEAARVYHQYKTRFDKIKDTSDLNSSDREIFKMWKRAEKDVVTDIDVNEVTQIKFIYPKLKMGDSIISKELNKQEYSGKDLQSYNTSHPDAAATKSIILSICAANNNNFDITNKMLLDELEGQLRKADAVNAAPRNYRGEIVKDNENDIKDQFYGNGDIMAATSMHGTHVSGIIGGARNNSKGIDGIADNVRIMTLRAVPDGDEHDKDIALAIRYAVDNGAKVVNMSFGKSISPQKKWVDDAVSYAESKGVLLIHAAGNESKNLDSSYNFPNGSLLESKKEASNWITVGASGDPKNGGIIATFSNYGKQKVDVFAPGVNIYSSLPGGNVYGNQSGTSMAAPVTSGVAAFLLQYYPSLSPAQVKSILEKSANVLPDNAINPGTGDAVKLSDLSKTGGVINAYAAARMADQLTGVQKTKVTKPTIKVKKPKKS